jgi:hypothetical protein
VGGYVSVKCLCRCEREVCECLYVCTCVCMCTRMLFQFFRIVLYCAVFQWMSMGCVVLQDISKPIGRTFGLATCSNVGKQRWKIQTGIWAARTPVFCAVSARPCFYCTPGLQFFLLPAHIKQEGGSIILYLFCISYEEGTPHCRFRRKPEALVAGRIHYFRKLCMGSELRPGSLMSIDTLQ